MQTTCIYILTQSITLISKLAFIKEWSEVDKDIISISWKLKYQGFSASESMESFLEQDPARDNMSVCQQKWWL